MFGRVRMLFSKYKRLRQIKDMSVPTECLFFLFGGHGLGVQSLLYFISKCTHRGKKIFPIQTDYIRTRELSEYIKERYWSFGKNLEWGLFFDGYPKDMVWINQNLKHKTPSILLVRDPILAILSNINFYLCRDVLKTQKIEDKTRYFDDFILSDRINEVCNYSSNLDYVRHLIEDLYIVDTTMLVGESTNMTMQKILNFLELDKTNEDFNIPPTNDAFSRFFPIIYNYKGVDIYVSPFPGKFIPYGPYNYCVPNSLFLLEEDYVSTYFPTRKLNISALRPTKFIEKNTMEGIKLVLENHLKNIKTKIDFYEEQKMTIEELLFLFEKHLNVKTKIQKKLDYETYDVSKINPEIFNLWKHYQLFMS